MLQYVKWSCERRGLPLHDKLRADQFYTDPACQDIFNNFMATLVSRVNTVTQCPYRCAQQNLAVILSCIQWQVSDQRLCRDDPTIFGWTLCNEPRCEGDYSASILQVCGLSAAACGCLGLLHKCMRPSDNVGLASICVRVPEEPGPQPPHCRGL